FPNDAYKNEDDKLNWAIEQTIVNRKITTSEKESIALNIPALENGWYVIEAITNDKNGRKITEKKYVQVFAPDNKGRISEALIAVPESQSKEPGTTAEVFTATGYETLRLIQQTIRSENKDTKHFTLPFGEGRGEAFS